VNDEMIVNAVNLLIEAHNYSALAQEMTHFVEEVRGGTPRYSGDLDPLNALISLGRANRAAFERVLKLVDEKRKEDPKTAKRDYQRDIMRERRQRMAKAILLHEARHGALKGEARTLEMASIRARWTRAKTQFIVDRSPPSAEDRLAAIRDFWDMVDRQLDANVANLRRTAAVA
jgi:hypothetical protein